MALFDLKYLIFRLPTEENAEAYMDIIALTMPQHPDARLLAILMVLVLMRLRAEIEHYLG